MITTSVGLPDNQVKVTATDKRKDDEINHYIHRDHDGVTSSSNVASSRTSALSDTRVG